MKKDNQTTRDLDIEASRLVLQCCQDWVDKGMKDECFWEGWEECPTEIDLTPRMVLDALKQKRVEDS